MFWSGHSQGRYSGSSWYAEQNWEELEKRALVHVNVDSTGGKGNTVVADTTAAAELRNLAREAIRDQGEQEFTNRRMSRAGDQSFWGIGVSSIYGNMSEQPATETANASAAVFGGRARVSAMERAGGGIRPTTLLDKIEEPILVRDTPPRIYLHTVWRLLSDPVISARLGRARGLPSAKRLLPCRALSATALTFLWWRSARGRLGVRAAELNRLSSELPDEANAARFNAALIAVSRALVPLDYHRMRPV